MTEKSFPPETDASNISRHSPAAALINKYLHDHFVSCRYAKIILLSFHPETDYQAFVSFTLKLPPVIALTVIRYDVVPTFG